MWLTSGRLRKLYLSHTLFPWYIMTLNLWIKTGFMSLIPDFVSVQSNWCTWRRTNACRSASITSKVSRYRYCLVSSSFLPSNETLDWRPDSFYQDEPPPLVVLQQKHWDPLLKWARSTFDVDIITFNSILANSQPDATKMKFDAVLAEFDPWQMAGMLLLENSLDPSNAPTFFFFFSRFWSSYGTCYLYH